MSPEAGQHVTKARETIAKARLMLASGLADEAGRAAYVAAFHAAQALIFERTGRTPKTHQGVRGQFGRLAASEPKIDIELRRFLARGYDIKSLVDYAVGPDAVVPKERAVDAVETAFRFVETVASVLGGP